MNNADLTELQPLIDYLFYILPIVITMGNVIISHHIQKVFKIYRPVVYNTLSSQNVINLVLLIILSIRAIPYMEYGSFATASLIISGIGLLVLWIKVDEFVLGKGE